VIVDGGRTALALVDEIAERHTGTFITHSPPVAALGARPGLEVVVVGGTLDPRAMVAVGAQAIEAYGRITADVCCLGICGACSWQRADRAVGLASRDKLGTTAQFGIAPATALTHVATERDVPAEMVEPFAELGLHVLR
jgi:DeoR/GlpR family transcriptional regulator of sugar metabolism